LHPGDYSSWDYLAGPEIVVDICQAIEARFAIDIASRYELATRPCIVEFGMPADHLEGAIASALWYLEAASRGERTTNAHWGSTTAADAVCPQHRSETSRSPNTRTTPGFGADGNASRATAAASQISHDLYRKLYREPAAALAPGNEKGPHLRAFLLDRGDRI
jgi:hypothetical protein